MSDIPNPEGVHTLECAHSLNPELWYCTSGGRVKMCYISLLPWFLHVSLRHWMYCGNKLY